MSKHTSLLIFLVAIILVIAGGSFAADLVSNGSFPSDVSGWHLVGRGSLDHSADGSAAPGALQIGGGLAGGATQAVAGQCLSPVTPGQTLLFGGSVRVVNGSPASCRIALFESAGADCSWIALGAEIRRTTFSGGWDALAGGSLTPGAGTGSIELRLHCTNAEGQTAALDVRFDDVVVSTQGLGDVIFSDGFETGNTGRWSSVVP